MAKPTPKIERRNPCGCVLYKVGSKYRWTLCDEAEKLKKAYEDDRKERSKYDDHFIH